jgi:hypothetical protein
MSFVECLVRLQAEVAGDDFLVDLAGAAEEEPDAAEPPELTNVVPTRTCRSSKIGSGSSWPSGRDRA